MALLLALVSELHQERRMQYGNTNEYWAQPRVLDSDQYPPMFAQRWDLDFTPFEQRLWSNSYDFTAPLNAGPGVLTLLEQLYKQINSSSSVVDESRLFFLIEQSLPGVKGEELARLLKRYLPYRTQSKAMLDQINVASVEQQPQLIEAFLETLEQRQIKSFTSVYYSEIFEEDNASLRFLLQSKLIRLRKDITAQQKSIELQKQQDSYAEFLRTHSGQLGSR